MFSNSKPSTRSIFQGIVFKKPQGLGQCKFGAAGARVHEPGSAIKAAGEAGAIRSRRYQSDLRMREG